MSDPQQRAPEPPPGESAERELLSALSELREEVGEDWFATDLHRTLTGRRWIAPSGAETSVSWQRGEEIINALRERAGEEPLSLAQTGEAREPSERVEERLSELGWSSRPLDPGTHEERHLSADQEAPPPAGQGEREAPAEPPAEWRERRDEAARRR